MAYINDIITARKRSCGKVMFLQVSVILLTGGCIPSCLGLILDHRPRIRHPLLVVAVRAVRILLECILVNINDEISFLAIT